MSAVRPELVIARDPEALANAAAAEFFHRAEDALRARGRFFVALAGGSTPALLFDRLVARHAAGGTPRLDDPRIAWFWGDERAVPPGHEASNFGLAHRRLLSPVRAAPSSWHRIEGEREDPEDAAQRYEAALRRVMGAAYGVPRFDLIWLGLGADGHVASLFPDDGALFERERLFVAARAPVAPRARITATLPLIAAARAVAFLVSGRGKSSALARLLAPEIASEPMPANLVAPTDGALLCFVDAEAVSGDVLAP